MKKVNKMTTSKKILWANFVLVGLLVVLLAVCVLAQIPCGEIGIVASAAFVELGVHTAVYAKKARAENAVKIAENVFSKIAEKYGADIAVQVFQSSIQE